MLTLEVARRYTNTGQFPAATVYRYLLDVPATARAIPARARRRRGSRARAWRSDPRRVDRIDSARGYEPDNVVACCGTCNTMKTDMAYDGFLAHVARIVALHPQAVVA